VAHPTQRAAPRHAIDAEITLSAAAGPLAHGRTRNLSAGGLCAVVTAPIARGTTVEVSISLVFEESGLSEPLTLPARVVWCTALIDGEQIGLAFLPLRPDQVAYLDMFIRFLVRSHEPDGFEPDDPFGS
jgi:hypothetical protein